MSAMPNSSTLTPWHSFALQKAPRDATNVIGHFGGHPRGVRAHQWPRCRVCGAPMCHMGQVEAGEWLDIGPYVRMSMFICHATGGRCEDWDAWKGANRVVLHRDRDDNLYDGPPTVRVYRRVRLGVDAPRDERRLLAAAKESGVGRREALDQLRVDKLGGAAVWWHRDDTPKGPVSGRKMKLLLQITTRIVTFDITRQGVAYVFRDTADDGEESAVMLWQAQ